MVEAHRRIRTVFKRHSIASLYLVIGLMIFVIYIILQRKDTDVDQIKNHAFSPKLKHLVTYRVLVRSILLHF